MRTKYNRQARRTALCINAHSPRGKALAISRRRLALTAYGDEIVRVAERIADDLEISTEQLVRIACGEN